ncbi:N-6 DNA methylase [Allokutzneria sp. A3M-2-11 16]|uniref:N-6 DNA methylase n=1 Tax=Allokutzneria sp. A3M-2-11 16 TaxID=2962043 RepID=UPI0020B86520|nr:N-6 DNA methylase [Allokutzneria sp. A3M-2-11 16]MCP3802005.1 N-6 DNA methylase [Allokutzneria sp. A3M-2-11 16]
MPAARTRRGQIYTPACVATLLAEMVTPDEHTTLHEPTAGTGGMLRAAAQAMRRNGKDPQTVTWIAGTVVVDVGDTLTEDWVTRAVRQREECTALGPVGTAWPRQRWHQSCHGWRRRNAEPRYHQRVYEPRYSHRTA